MNNAPDIADWDGYREDAVYVTEETTLDEIVTFVRNSIEDPIEQDGTVVWNFSNHKFSYSRVDWKSLNHNRYVVPFNVTGVWGFMFSLLPKEIKNSETLVYYEDREKYFALTNFHRTMPDEQIEQIQYDTSMRVQESLAEIGDE